MSEAREDLERDEEIFAGKLADIEKYQGMIKALHRENRALKKARGGSESLPAEARRDGRLRESQPHAVSVGGRVVPSTLHDNLDSFDVRGSCRGRPAARCRAHHFGNILENEGGASFATLIQISNGFASISW